MDKGLETDNHAPTSADPRWEIAKKFHSHLGNPHPIFSAVIRILKIIARDGMKRASYLEEPQILTLYQSPRVKSILYFAAEAMHEKELKALQPNNLNGTKLLSLFPADELGAIFASAYLYKRVAKLAEPKSWAQFGDDIQIQMEAGALIGKAIPSIGVARGLIAGLVRYASMLLFYTEDQKGWPAFRRDLSKAERLFMIDLEQKRWGCTHLNIAAIILQTFGFGVAAADAALVVDSNDSSTSLSDEGGAWLAAFLWIQALLEDEKGPARVANDPRFTLPPEKFAELQQVVDAINEKGASFAWLDKTKHDLPEGVLAQLSRKFDTGPTEIIEEPTKDDLPEGVFE